MTKEQFITSLRRELKKLPPEEVVSATEYYEEYFAEALDNPELTAEELAAEEARLIGEIGSPKAVAAQIKSEYASRVLSGDETTLKYKPTVGNKISATWWIILGVLAAPVGIPIAIALGAVVFSLWIAVFAVVISLYAGGIGILAGGLAALVLGIITCLVLLDRTHVHRRRSRSRSAGRSARTRIDIIDQENGTVAGETGTQI